MNTETTAPRKSYAYPNLGPEDVQAVATIVGGLLASGHYTRPFDGGPLGPAGGLIMLEEDCGGFEAVEDALEILDDIKVQLGAASKTAAEPR